jgi:hypothetical protein
MRSPNIPGYGYGYGYGKGLYKRVTVLGYGLLDGASALTEQWGWFGWREGAPSREANGCGLYCMTAALVRCLESEHCWGSPVLKSIS